SCRAAYPVRDWLARSSRALAASPPGCRGSAPTPARSSERLRVRSQWLLRVLLAWVAPSNIVASRRARFAIVREFRSSGARENEVAVTSRAGCATELAARPWGAEEFRAWRRSVKQQASQSMGCSGTFGRRSARASELSPGGIVSTL